MNYDKLITKNMSDETIIKKYTEALYGESPNMLAAGIYAGEMDKRGYDIVEDEDDPYKFIKKPLAKQEKSKAA